MDPLQADGCGRGPQRDTRFIMIVTRGLLLLVIIAFGVVSPPALSQSEDVSELSSRIAELEHKVDRQGSEISRVEEIAKNTAPVIFLFGAFCALWAQNTGRSAWLWFFMGAIFNVFAVVALLIKNEPPDHRRPPGRDGPDRPSG